MSHGVLMFIRCRKHLSFVPGFRNTPQGPCTDLSLTLQGKVYDQGDLGFLTRCSLWPVGDSELPGAGKSIANSGSLLMRMVACFDGASEELAETARPFSSDC